MIRVIRRFLSSTVSSTGPLAGIKVLDLTRVLAGPYCTMILGDLGADVVKVEEPRKGDDTRSWGPPWTAGKSHKLSAYFVSVNRNKRSIALDLKKPEGRAILKELAKNCDVMVHNYLPETAKSLEIDFERMSGLNERMVYAAISGYGEMGPDRNRPGYDVIIEAEAGMMHITGTEDGPPVKVGVAVTDLSTGLYAHGAILAALFARERTGKGQRIDLSLLECQIASLVNIGSNYLVGGQEAKRMGTGHASIVPYQVFQTGAGGYIMVGAGNDRQFKALCEKIGMPELSVDEKYSTNANRVANRQSLVASLQQRFMTKSTDEWIKVLDGSKVPVGPVNNIEQTFQLPQLKHQQMIAEVNHPKVGDIKMAGIPVKYSQTKPSIRLPPPLLGEHSESVLKSWLQFSDASIEQLKQKEIIKTA